MDKRFIHVRNYIFQIPGTPGGPARLINHGRGFCFLVFSTICGVLDWAMPPPEHISTNSNKK